MLRVGVKLGAALTDAGEYLADVAALEAAGADSVWLDVKDGAAAEPWILLGAISTATQRVRVGMLVDASGGWPPPTDLLGRLTRGRLIVGIQRGHPRVTASGGSAAITRAHIDTLVVSGLVLLGVLALRGAVIFSAQ